jgi:type I restriction enzyme S subunit
MGLKPSYKQTEVGVIPDDWDVVRTDACARRITDGEHATPKRTSSGYYLLSARNVLNGRLDLSDVDFVGEDEYQRIRHRCNPEAGDVLISCSGTVGRVAVVPAGFECVMVRSAALVKPDTAKLFGLFAQYFYQSEAGQRQILATLNQAAQPNLFLNHIQGLLIPLPPTKGEQEAIATALSDADALIESLEQLIAKKRQLKQGAMQELFIGKRRLPGFGGAWEVKRLDELGIWKGGMTPSMREPEYWQGGSVPWISSGDVKSARLSATGFSITRQAIDRGTTTLLPEKSIVIVTRSGILRRYLPVAMNMIPMAINQDIKALIPNDGLSSDYLLQVLIANGERILSRCLKSGTTVESIEFSWLKSFTVPIPSLPEQTAIASMLSDMDAEIAALETKLAKARHIKQGMMQELLTGKIRLA